MKDAHNLPWLVKSSGRILGPYDQSKIEELLKTREIVVLDEVAQPLRRFRFIRDVPAFARIVEELRKESTGDLGDKTFTESTEGQTVSLTEPMNSQIIDELTDELGFSTDSAGEIVYEDIEEVRSKPAPSATQSRYQAGDLGGKTISHQAEAASKWLWWATGLVIVGVLGFIGFQKWIQEPAQIQASTQELIQQGEQLVEEGKLSEALEAFKKAYSLDPDNGRFYHFMGPLLIQFEGQTVLGRRLLDKALSLQPNFQAQLYTSMGVADLKDGDWRGAGAHFRKALELKPGYEPAEINIGVLSLHQKDYNKAKEYFEKVIKEGTSDGAVPLLLAESLIQKAQTEKKYSYLSDAVAVLSGFEDKGIAYKQELLLLKSYLQSVTDQRQKAEESVSQFLNIDPLATELHTRNIFVARYPVAWEELLTYCLPLTRTLNPTGRVAAMTGLCYLKAGKPQEAHTEVQTALQRSPRDPLVQAVSAFVLQKIGQEHSGSVSLGKALEFDRAGEYRLPLILQARFYYQSGDLKSAKDYWRQLLNRDSQSLEANAGLAQIAFDEGLKEEFKRYIRAAHKISKDYIPVTSLMVRAKRMGWEI